MKERMLEQIVASDERWSQLFEREAAGDSMVEEYAFSTAARVVTGELEIDELRLQANELNELNREAAEAGVCELGHEDDRFEVFARRTAHQASLAALELVKNKRRREIFRFKHVWQSRI